MGGEQDIRKMGGLHAKMKITSITFLIGCLAISGVPLFSGFFSKDEILATAYGSSKILYWGGVIAAMMTAFYMFRLYTLTFTGKFRGTHEQEHHLHESPAAMTIPLVILAIFSIIGGYVGLPAVISEHHTLGEFLGKVVTNATHGHLSHEEEWLAMGISTVASLAMIIWGVMANRNPSFTPNTGFAKVLEDKWYMDEFYDKIIVQPLLGFAGFADKYVERQVIDGGVNGVGRLVKWGADRMRLVQNGQVGFYIFIMVVGIIALFAIGFFIQNV
jgi:NADH-quinone oxidoreductase subunit L